MFTRSLFRRRSSPSESVASPSNRTSTRDADRRSRSLTVERIQLRAAGTASQQGRKQFQNEDKLRMLPDDGFALVLDGHSGAQCARFVVENLGTKYGKIIAKKWKESSGSTSTPSSSSSVSTGLDDDATWEVASKLAMVKAFKDIDNEFLRMARFASDESATSAVCCAIRFSRVVVASVGRCSALYICKDGAVARLTLSHDVRNREELDRVLRSCDMKDPTLRLRDVPLRAFGDFKLKLEKAIISVPALTTVEMEKGSYLLLCTDGVTDSMNDEDIGRFVCDGLGRSNGDLEAVAEELVQATTRATGDDSSVVLMAFW